MTVRSERHPTHQNGRTRLVACFAAGCATIMAASVAHALVTAFGILFANGLTLPESRQFLLIVVLSATAFVWMFGPSAESTTARNVVAGAVLAIWVVAAAPPWYWPRSEMPSSSRPHRGGLRVRSGRARRLEMHGRPANDMHGQASKPRARCRVVIDGHGTRIRVSAHA